MITHLAGGRFEPEVSIGFVGNDFLFRNEDDTLHTTHLYLQLAYQKEISGRPLVNGATVYNIALPKQGMEVRRPIRPYHGYRDDTGYIAVKCNPHPNEQAAVLVFDHPFAAVTGEDGEFLIPDLPAGRHEVWVWQDGMPASGNPSISRMAPQPRWSSSWSRAREICRGGERKVLAATLSLAICLGFAVGLLVPGPDAAVLRADELGRETGDRRLAGGKDDHRRLHLRQVRFRLSHDHLSAPGSGPGAGESTGPEISAHLGQSHRGHRSGDSGVISRSTRSIPSKTPAVAVSERPRRGDSSELLTEPVSR